MAVDLPSGSKHLAFDHVRLAAAVAKATGKPVDAQKLPFDAVTLTEDGKSIVFRIGTDNWQVDLATYEVKPGPPLPPGGRGPRGPRPREDRAPDSPTYGARIVDGQVQVHLKPSGEWKSLTKEGGFTSYRWAANGKNLLAIRTIPGDRRLVYLLKSSVPGTTRAQLESRIYPQPGDALDTYEPYALDAEKSTETKIAMDPLMEVNGTENWGDQIVVTTPVRGYQGYRVIGFDPVAATGKVLVDEKLNTFVDISKTELRLLADKRHLIWQSERDGWSHFYMIDTVTGETKPIDKGNWVMRKLDQLDEPKGQIWFTASGMGDQDPYQIHECRINLDGSKMIDLTPGDGTHTLQFSPHRKFFVDSYSRVDMAPHHELRRADDGKLIATLEVADISELLKKDVHLPERFVAKGRDGKTDIWGVVIRPSNFDPNKTYPVIENIYAGPQDSFVPKAFRPYSSMTQLSELGFIVVQIDGMGTDNRGKAFHDVCFKNLQDAGFPDRILWLQALAKKYPQVDVSRVGIYGTSAGGQNSTGALLFHPEFYKVAVSSCGCHDNRIDKQWWNEQWMSLPVGKEYDDASNITNAAKLRGHLLLFVGENDRNVPPESTYRLCDALIKANKEFDMLVIPGADHTDGGPYGEHKRRDYFVRYLLGVDPPSWNGG